MTINTTPINADRLAQDLPLLYQTKHPFILLGQPGVGKSSVIKQFAKENNYKLYDLRLTTLDAVDLRGLCFVDEVARRTVYFTPEFYPTEESLKAEGYDGAILFLDEISNCDSRMQVSAHELLLDRTVGSYRLPDNCLVCAAGNTVDDNSGAYEISAALADRLIIYMFEANAQQWIKKAPELGVCSEVLSFIKYKPIYLNSSEGELASTSDDNLINTSPRSWVKVSDFVKLTTDINKLHYIVSGIVGKAAAAEFFYFLEEFNNLVPFEELLKNVDKPTKLKALLPTKIGGLYGLAYSCVPYGKDVENVAAIIKIMNVLCSIKDGLPREEIRSLTMSLVLQTVIDNNIISDVISLPEYEQYYETCVKPYK